MNTGGNHQGNRADAMSYEDAYQGDCLSAQFSERLLLR